MLVKVYFLESHIPELLGHGPQNPDRSIDHWKPTPTDLCSKLNMREIYKRNIIASDFWLKASCPSKLYFHEKNTTCHMNMPFNPLLNKKSILLQICVRVAYNRIKLYF
jgi:hypothetical protein